ncbi:MAG TPA: NAD-dependent epimerase/dehydratase family protein [Longimicrobium sp.]|jgi:2'-hydroxyisoflavone reductase
MRLLVLGGTRFIGRHLVEMALARGDEVTLFNRGKTDPRAFPGVEHVAGDRAEGLGQLGARTFDAVIDTSGYVPAWVRRSVEATAATAGHYVFVSTISVYSAAPRAGMDEDGPLYDPDWTSTSWRGGAYGPMKVACETVVRERRPDAAIVRPGVVIGPGDYTDRFPYWVRRVGRGGEVLAPGDPARPVQGIDARDLAAFLLHAATERTSGTFNAVGPDRPTTLGGMLETIRDVAGSDARFTWVDDAFLHARGFKPWGEDLPFWADPSEADFFTLSNRRAVEAGLRLRPLAESARDTAAWEPTRKAEARNGGLSPGREAELLAEWHARGSGG